MAPTNGKESYKPHFILEQSLGMGAIVALQRLEATIHTDPVAVQHVVATLDTPPEKDRNTASLRSDVVIATSREVGLEFDDTTEETIARSGAMKALRDKRKAHQANEEVSRQLAAEVRRTRLALFIEQVIDQQAAVAPVVPLPQQSTRNRIRTRRKSESA